MLVIVKAKFKRVISVPVSRAMGYGTSTLNAMCAHSVMQIPAREFKVGGHGNDSAKGPRSPLHTALSMFNRNDS